MTRVRCSRPPCTPTERAPGSLSLNGVDLPSPARQLATSALGLADQATAPLRSLGARLIRRSLGGDGPPPAPAADATAALPPTAVAREVHADLPSMLVGGVAALFVQSLHPLAAQGVVEHSDYRHDPLGRLQRTALFLGTTTFGSREDAEQAIAVVRAVHTRVQGIAPDGRAYAAGDPELLTFVHVAELACFASAYQRYGPRRLAEHELDAYVAELAPVAEGLGAGRVPRSWAGLLERLEGYRGELERGDAAREIRAFLLRGPGGLPPRRAAYGLVVAAALELLDDRYRGLLGLPKLPLVEAAAVRPAAGAMALGLRWVVRPPEGAFRPSA